MLTARKVFSTSLVISATSGRADTGAPQMAVRSSRTPPCGACRAGAAHHPRGDILARAAPLPGSMRSGLNATKTSSTHLESPCGQRLDEQSRVHADVGGRGEHDGLPGHRVLHHVGAGPAQRPQIRGLVGVHRGGHAHHDRVGPGQHGGLGGQLERVGLQVPRQPLAVADRQIDVAALDVGQPVLAHVVPDDAGSVVGQAKRGGRPT